MATNNRDPDRSPLRRRQWWAAERASGAGQGHAEEDDEGEDWEAEDEGEEE